jgi:AcrR family transcriptional regulator
MATGERRLRKDAERNRQRILAAAQELFAERGQAVTLNEIARHAGVGVGTVYRRFPDKDELVEELFEQRIDRIAEILDRALAHPDPWRGFVDFFEASVEEQAADRGLRQLMLGAAGAYDRIAKARERLQPLVSRLVERARDAGELRADFDVPDIGIVQIMLGSVVDLTYELEPELWRRYSAIVLQGLRARPEPPARLDVPALPFEQFEAVMVEAHGPPARRP